MADPKTTTTGTTTTGTTPGATTTGTTTQANYNAEAVRVAPTGTADRVHKDNSSTKGLIVGVLTFLLLSLWEWLSGPGEAATTAGDAVDSITFVEMLIYAVVGIIVGLIVKAIDKARHDKARHDKV